MGSETRRRNPVAGFTFLELLVALAILGSSFVVLLTAHSSAARQQSSARRLMVATLLAREVLTETEVEGFPELGGDTGEFGAEFPGYTWQRDVLTTPFDLAREVHVQVSWPDRGRAETLDLVFYAVAGQE
ncbi:MAG: prepilin-type N-terminal cleavage/methylation domain-containing protein [Deferrisomatales bacterium]|nr:prepilin-type N-terminal cleavage/methylation domain-containing protein [Deferrisomatales bacterium]